MHICHFCETSVEGAYFRHLAQGLTRRGVTVSLIELGAYKPPTWISDMEGVKYFNLNIKNRLQYPLAIWRLSKYLRREKIDLLQTHLYYGGLIGVLTKYLPSRKPVALTRHHTSVVHMLGKWPHIAADKWMAENADFVVTVSEAAKRFMIQADHIKRKDIEVVHLGFDFEEFDTDLKARNDVREEFGFTDANLVIGYVANFPQGKGHLELLEAFAHIVHDFPTTKLLLVGDGDRTRIDAAINHLGIGASVVLSGWRNDNAPCLNAMDIFVQPSLSEAFSQVLIEAMGVGLPVIATRVGGAEEVISDGSNGILVPPGSPEAIAEKVLMLLADPTARNSMALAGQASVRENFGVERMLNKQMALYNNWLGHKN